MCRGQEGCKFVTGLSADSDLVLCMHVENGVDFRGVKLSLEFLQHKVTLSWKNHD